VYSTHRNLKKKKKIT